jgi:hypothetical protein
MITMPVAHGLSDAEMAVFLGLVIGVPAFFVGADVLLSGNSVLHADSPPTEPGR